MSTYSTLQAAEADETHTSWCSAGGADSVHVTEDQETEDEAPCRWLI